MHARLARRATAIQVLCGGICSRYNDSSYVGSKVSLQTDRQQELLKAFLTADGSKINAKQNVVTSSDGSQMVTETNNVACKPAQRCPKSVLTALTRNYLTALVILATTLAVKAAVLLSVGCRGYGDSHGDSHGYGYGMGMGTVMNPHGFCG